jgi:hypothetical protein
MNGADTGQASHCIQGTSARHRSQRNTATHMLRKRETRSARPPTNTHSSNVKSSRGGKIYDDMQPLLTTKFFSAVYSRYSLPLYVAMTRPHGPIVGSHGRVVTGPV